jgi:Protein of unknown function (DUF2971)
LNQPLYKFISSPEHVRYLVSGQLKFTPIGELNDPSELAPTFNEQSVRESLQHYRMNGYSEEDMLNLKKQGHLLSILDRSALAVQVPKTKEDATKLIRSPFYDQAGVLEKLLMKTATTMSGKVGLLCLTKRFDSLPMWAHYANNGRGIVVEFGDLTTEFPGDETGTLNQSIEVQYEKEDTSVTFDPTSHRSIFFSKFADWSYEREVRVVRPLIECSASHLPNGQILYTHKVNPLVVVGIICGWNMTPDEVHTVKDEIRSCGSSATVKQAQLIRGHIVLNFL